MFEGRDRRMIYAVLVAIAWGAVASLLHAPYWSLIGGALISGGLFLWLERQRITRSGANMDNLMLIAPAYIFLSMVAFGLAGMAYVGIRLWRH
jgi:hypothetical protein